MAILQACLQRVGDYKVNPGLQAEQVVLVTQDMQLEIKAKQFYMQEVLSDDNKLMELH